MENDGVFILCLLSIVSGCFYGSYRLGRHLERAAYTREFIKEVEAAYWEGYGDRAKQDMLYGKP